MVLLGASALHSPPLLCRLGKQQDPQQTPAGSLLQDLKLQRRNRSMRFNSALTWQPGTGFEPPVQVSLRVYAADAHFGKQSAPWLLPAIHKRLWMEIFACFTAWSKSHRYVPALKCTRPSCSSGGVWVGCRACRWALPSGTTCPWPTAVAAAASTPREKASLVFFLSTSHCVKAHSGILPEQTQLALRHQNRLCPRTCRHFAKRSNLSQGAVKV